MKILEENYFLENFSHVYIEREIINSVETTEILNRINFKQIVEIEHYKDVFNKQGQSNFIQAKSKKLILAKNENNFIYSGSSMCNSFNNKNFYYMSMIKNCIYNCEYCYLKGMYNTSNILVFINIDKAFKDVEKLLYEKKNIYLCISYDSDLLAMENILGYVGKWIDFAKKHDNIIIEIRTKSTNINVFLKSSVPSNIIFSMTLSPKEIAKKFEVAPGLKSRVEAINRVMDRGLKVRLCIDPIIKVKNYMEIYNEFFKYISENIDLDNIFELSLGVFRIGNDYYKRMYESNEKSEILSYVNKINDSHTYSDVEEIKFWSINELSKFMDKGKIYFY